jgi:hypothetical protein
MQSLKGEEPRVVIPKIDLLNERLQWITKFIERLLNGSHPKKHSRS